MSACVSMHGEYPAHTFGSAGDERFVCQLCGLLDEDVALEALSVAEATLDRVRAALAREHWQTTEVWAAYGPITVCGRCRYGDGVRFPWPCPTLQTVGFPPPPHTRAKPPVAVVPA